MVKLALNMNEEQIIVEAKVATDQLRPVFQELLNKNDPPIVTSAILKGFFKSLREAGATDDQCDHWANALDLFDKEYNSKKIQLVYKKVSKNIDVLILKKRLNPVSVAYSLAGAVSSIVKNFEDQTGTNDKIMETLLTYINQIPHSMNPNK